MLVQASFVGSKLRIYLTELRMLELLHKVVQNVPSAEGRRTRALQITAFA